MHKVFINNQPVIIADNKWQSFCKKYKIIEAAGGLVFNEKKELLMIYRYDTWDLPKGKIDTGEKPEEAALREVCEETGVCDCVIIKDLTVTYHTYIHKEKNILKKTFWFEMRSKNPADLKVQIEEGITEAKWMNKKETGKALENTYPSLVEVLRFRVSGFGF